MDRLFYTMVQGSSGKHKHAEQTVNKVIRFLSAGAPKAIVHFIGGAFVGAAPQLSYRLLLESLAAKGLYVSPGPIPDSPLFYLMFASLSTLILSAVFSHLVEVT